MIALLGVMMAVMAIISGLVTLLFAALGFFGYKTIEDRSVSAAEKKAEEIAIRTIAESRAAEQQGEALSISQPTASKKKGSKLGSSKKTSDSSLVSGDQNDSE